MIERIYKCDLCGHKVQPRTTGPARLPEGWRLHFSGQGAGQFSLICIEDTVGSDQVICRGCAKAVAEHFAEQCD